MIKSFKHKGLEKFFTKGNTAGIQVSQATRINDRLAFLNAAQTIDDMDKPNYRLHSLKGDKKGLGQSMYLVTGALFSNSKKAMLILLTTRIITDGLSASRPASPWGTD